jgi:outer membrane protein insertion porin family
MSLVRKDAGRRDVLAVRVAAGHVRAFGEPFETGSLSFVGGAPFLSRYFLGGEDTIRGYGAAEVAPRLPVAQFVTQSEIVAMTVGGRALDVVSPRDANRGTIAPGPIRKLTYDRLPGATGLTSVGGDTQVLLNAEYRVALAGPLSVAAFADVGSAFNARPLEDLTTSVTYSGIPVLSYVVVNPRGQFATPEEIAAATTPETPGGAIVPPGFRAVQFLGDREVRTDYRLSWAADGFRENLRSTVGAELRVTLPVVNLPVRLILGYNPHEGRPVYRFAFGRTF